MDGRTPGLNLFWIGVVLAATFSIIVTWGLIGPLRNPIMEEVSATVCNLDGPLFCFWATTLPLSSVVASIAAFVYASTKPAFPWLAGIVVLGAVLAMHLLWSRGYSPPLFGVGGATILISFFATVRIWLKRYGALGIQDRIAGGYRLIGYLFCGLTPHDSSVERPGDCVSKHLRDLRCQSRSSF